MFSQEDGTTIDSEYQREKKKNKIYSLLKLKEFQ